jgi:ribosome biogenesis GTPase
MVIDTPGIREFGLWQVTPAQVRSYFHEFDTLSDECGFSDCSHTHEPNCAVIPAVETGPISSARYDSYRRIMDSIE